MCAGIVDQGRVSVSGAAPRVIDKTTKDEITVLCI